MDDAVAALEVGSLAPWTPVRVHGSSAESSIDWAVIGAPFAETFFEQTADRAMQHPFNQVFGRTTPIEILDEFATTVPPVEPAGFVFHMSRCGSTLIAQMLSRLTGSVVLSEAQPLDGLLGLLGVGMPGDETAVRRIRGMIAAVIGPQRGERRVFVKFHAWHVFNLPLMTRAFPDTPWVFAFREPRAVLRSQEKMSGAEIVPGALDSRLAGIEPDALVSIDPGEYCARMLAAFCGAALAQAASGRALFVDYRTLPEAVFTRVLPFFGVTPTIEEERRMREVAAADTKGEGAFRPPDAPPAADEIDRLATVWLDPLYEALRSS